MATTSKAWQKDPDRQEQVQHDCAMAPLQFIKATFRDAWPQQTDCVLPSQARREAVDRAGIWKVALSFLKEAL
jgi:hypothetical protein